MQAVGILLLVILFLLLSPVIVPVALLLHLLDRRRMAAVAMTYSCTGCGETLGKEALRLSDARWNEYIDAFRAKHPDAKLRLSRPVDAICTRCGRQFRYLADARSFQEVQEVAMET